MTFRWNCEDQEVEKMVQLPGNWKAQMFYQKGRRLRWKHQKDGKFVEAQSMDNLTEMSSMSSASASLMRLAPYSLSTNHHGHGDVLSSGAALLGTRRLLEENNQALNKISANLSTFMKGSGISSRNQIGKVETNLDKSGINQGEVFCMLQDNVDLFFQTKNNLTAILNKMKNMPGIMSQMPPLPVFLNEELASSLPPSSAQPMMFGCRSGIQLKQEPAC
ncbi:hypothetical protein MTR67_016496 [Solanum verrucosum]|uniref:Uncharacterized protein n=1 Tax=Solanum verrucosum TaxID=315347 RepID=A0AAF0QM27_SOLVR|nr:hypothetical protein MTR67_016496 [Solanum verrucosum]